MAAPPLLSSWQPPMKAGARRRTELLDCTDVPSHQKIPFILCGYRPPPQGPLGLLKTMFTLHNETGNIWTHLLGAAYFAVLGVRLCGDLMQAEQHHAPFEVSVVLALVVASDFCLVSSFVYHLCKCASHGVCQCTYKLDLSGIVVLIGASYFCGIALGFRCTPTVRLLWLVYAAVIVAALSAPLLFPGMMEDHTCHFIACVALGLVPAAHYMYISDTDEMLLVLPYLLAMFGCYGIGAWFFVQKLPERIWPGRFDLIGHSHQVWHVFVVLAAMSWAQAGLRLLEHFGNKEC